MIEFVSLCPQPPRLKYTGGQHRASVLSKWPHRSLIASEDGSTLSWLSFWGNWHDSILRF